MLRQSLRGISRPLTALAAFLLVSLSATSEAQTTGSPERPNAGPLASLSGYMDLQFVDPSNADAFIDFRRFVLLFAHRFSDRIRFVSELEVEHAIVEGGDEKGELELEQAYLDFLIDRRFNIRAGQLLVPVGIINERHEPPTFHGVQRPFVDTFIIPTTWFDAGAGVFGEFSRGWRYRAYAMAPLNATAFSAGEGLADSAQQGSRAVVRHWAGTGRLEYLGVPRLTLGASIWSGRTTTGSPLLDPRVTLVEADGRGRLGRLELRGEMAHVFVGQADELNRLRALREGIDPNIASQMFGAYLEAAHPILPFPSPREVVGFVRYEEFDTQFRMPAGYQPIGAFKGTAWIMGVSYFPDPDVVVKVDYTIGGNQSLVVAPPRAFSVGLGWWF
jgi:hypothetical protein